MSNAELLRKKQPICFALTPKPENVHFMDVYFLYLAVKFKDMPVFPTKIGIYKIYWF